MRARPSLHAMRCSPVASLREVGLESGKMTGRSIAFAMARMTGSLKAPAWPDTPISAVGGAFETTSRRLILFGVSSRQPVSASGPCRKGICAGVMPAMPSTSSPLRSMRKNRRRASASLAPASIIACHSREAMPQPADPAPSMAIRCSPSAMPVTLMAARSVPVAIAAVPSISSLKLHSRSR